MVMALQVKLQMSYGGICPYKKANMDFYQTNNSTNFATFSLRITKDLQAL